MSTDPNQQEQPYQMPFATITERPINTAGPGPYYIYSPGLDFTGLRNMIYLFNTIPAGEVFPITSDQPVWTNKLNMPEGAAAYERTVKNMFGEVTDRHVGRIIPAGDTLYALQSDRSLTNLGLTQIPAFDGINAEAGVFNQLIHPERIPQRKFPTDKRLRKVIEEEGMLALRSIWLNEALESLETERILEPIRRVIEDKPYLLEVWKDAIRKTLIPSIDAFTVKANMLLADKEEKIRAKEMKVYDPFCLNLMWLLARKPERTALSRTLEAASLMGGKSGLGVEEIRAIMQEMMSGMIQVMGNNQQTVSVVDEFVQCGNCGNKCEMVAGGPPRICWRCQNPFHAATIPEQPVRPIVEVATPSGNVEVKSTEATYGGEELVRDSPPLEEPSVGPTTEVNISALAQQIMQNKKSEE